MERRDQQPKESYLSGCDNRSESYPGLNKDHGLFSLIQRNQRDRDDYHHRMKQAKKTELQKQKSERESRSRPSLPLYSPPHRHETAKGRGATTSPCKEGQNGRNPCRNITRYRVEVELHPQHWVAMVLECGEEVSVVDKLAEDHGLSVSFREALLQMMTHYQHNLVS